MLLRGALQKGKKEELKPDINSQPKPQPSVPDSVSDYYYRFRQFCAFYPLRELHLAGSILDTMSNLSSSMSPSFSILDVGSAGGELLAAVVFLLRANSEVALRCVAVESDPVAFARLGATAELLRKSGRVVVDCIQAKIEDVMAGRQPMPLEEFDCILCSHVFYHFKNWPGVITNFLSWISPGGRIVVILDSHNSPIYQFRESLETTLGHHAAIQEYGDLASAEDFLKFLKASGFSYSYRGLDWKLALTPDRLITDLEDILSFLYRFPVNGRKKVRLAVQQFTKKFRSGGAYMFPWKEGLFLIQK